MSATKIKHVVRKPLGFTLLLSLLIVMIFCTGSMQRAISAESLPTAPPTDKTPAYFYDHETAFVIEYSMDKTNDGIYLALDPSTNQPFGTITDNVYGNLGAQGSDKHTVGHGVCIRYFIQEYQRITTSGQGIIGINAVLNDQMSSANPLTDATDLIGYAQSCADFIKDHLVIPVNDGLSGGTEDCPAGFCTPDSDQGDMVTPNMFYLYNSSNEDGSGNLLDDSSIPANMAAARVESSVIWSVAELALLLKSTNGDTCGADCQTYLDVAVDYWDWRYTSAAATPFFNSNNFQIGVSRDLFYPALGFILTEITGDTSYRDGGASSTACPSAATNADSTMCGAIPFMDAYLGTGSTPNMPYPAAHALQDGSYIAGFGRSVAFTLHEKTYPSDATGRDQWWDFGSNPLIDYGNTSNLRDPNEVESGTTANFSIAFSHFNGREVLVGVQRSAMFFRNSGVNPGIWWGNASGQSDADFADMAVGYWDFINNNMWDDTEGQRSWYESTSLGYKPCFSAGTEMPFADANSPVINSSSNDFACGDEGLGVDINFTVNTDDLALDSDYMSWEFKGFGVDTVEVLWTCDSGVASGGDPAAFNSLSLSGAEPNYSGTLTSGTILADCGSDGELFYYTKVTDKFGNETALSPNGTPEANTTASDWWETGSATLSTDTSLFGRISCAPVVPDDVVIGDLVWLETDGDGDASTASLGGLEDVLVTAADLDTNIFTTTTDSNGQYTLTVPANATYTVTVATPLGYNPSNVVATGAETDATGDTNNNLSHDHAGAIVVVTDQPNANLDFGFRAGATAVELNTTSTSSIPTSLLILGALTFGIFTTLGVLKLNRRKW